jgi:hypothetical protein
MAGLDVIVRADGDPPPPELLFGHLLGQHSVDAAIVQMLKKWEATYLHEVARQAGERFERLTPIRSYRIASDMENMPEDQHPALIIQTPGLVDPPTKRAVGSQTGKAYTGVWEYRLGVQTVAKGRKEVAVPRAIRLASLYATAIRGIMVQQRDEPPDGNGILGMIDWFDERPDGVDSDGDRTTCLYVNYFYVEVHDVTTWGTGPIEPNWPPDPDDQPPDPDSPTWPQATLFDVEIIKVPLDEPIPEGSE